MNLRRFVAVGVIILLVIIGIVWLIAARSTRPEQDRQVTRPSALVDYADTTTEVRFTQAGKINAREDHRVVQISVGRDYRTIQLFDGYQGNVMNSRTLGNDEDAYRAFLAALENSGYVKSRNAPRNVDPLGACSSGSRYNYDILQGADIKQSLWSTSCGNSSRGTFNGKASAVRSLFQAQIPNYQDFVSGVQF